LLHYGHIEQHTTKAIFFLGLWLGGHILPIEFKIPSLHIVVSERMPMHQSPRERLERLEGLDED